MAVPVWPGRWELFTEIRPPCRRTISAVAHKLNPVPLSSLVWENESKSERRASTGIPFP